MKKLKNIASMHQGRNALIILGIVIAVLLLYVWKTNGKTIGVIDFSVVQAQAKVYQSVLAEQKKYEDQIKINIITNSGDLEKEAQSLEKQKASLKPEEYQKKVSALQQKILRVQEKYRPVVERIAFASQIALRNGAAKYVDEAVKKTAKQKNVKVILPKTATLHADDSVNVTDTFIKNLDELVQSVPYPDPAKL